jgi:hypothetical protein
MEPHVIVLIPTTGILLIRSANLVGGFVKIALKLQQNALPAYLPQEMDMLTN